MMYKVLGATFVKNLLFLDWGYDIFWQVLVRVSNMLGIVEDNFENVVNFNVPHGIFLEI